MNIIYEEAKKRIPRQKDIILSMLRDAGEKGVTNTLLKTVAIRFGASLGELYQEGYKIDTIHVDGGVVKYILREEPKEDFKRKKHAKDIFIETINSKFGNGMAEVLVEIMDELNVNLRYKVGTHKH